MSATGMVGAIAAADAAPPWPASEDRPVTAGEELDDPALAAAADGTVVVALTQFDVASGASVRVLRSDTEGDSFASLGIFWDPDPVHGYVQPQLAVLDEAGVIVLAMLEQVAGGFQIAVATTPLSGPPQWTSVIAASGVDLRGPVLEAVEEPSSQTVLHLLVPSIFIGAGRGGPAGGEPGRVAGGRGAQFVASRLEYTRSTDGGTTWQPPSLLVSVPFPGEIGTPALAAGDGGRLHVTCTAGPLGDRELLYTRHPDRGDTALAWDPPRSILAHGDDVLEGDVTAAGSSPYVIALYRRPGTGLLAAWSPDHGDTFAIGVIEVVGANETPDGARLDAAAGEAHLVYRNGSAVLRYRSLPLDDPGASGFASTVSDIGEPALVPFGIDLRPGSGPGVFWLRDDGGSRTAFIDAYWFPSTVGVGESEGSGSAAGGGSGPAAPRLRAMPNPFRLGVALEVERPAGAAAQVRVFDASGRLVRQLLDGVTGGGRDGESGGGGRRALRLRWDGLDARGRRVPAGAYFVVVRTPGQQRTLRVIRLP